MIEVTMTDTNGVTLATAGTYCPEDIHVINGVSSNDGGSGGESATVSITSTGSNFTYRSYITGHADRQTFSPDATITDLKVGDSFLLLIKRYKRASSSTGTNIVTFADPVGAILRVYHDSYTSGSSSSATYYNIYMALVTITEPVVSISFS